MTVADESCDTEVSSSTTYPPTPKPGLLHPKIVTRLGTWNTRTLNQLGKKEEAAKEMKRYNLDILAIQESRLIGQGRSQIALENWRGEILWSGEEKYHQAGVAVILNKKASDALLAWKPISERIIYIRLGSKFSKLSLIICYAPTENAEEETKENFYYSLQAVIDTVPYHDVLLVLGDFNAKVGSNREHREAIMGKEGIGTANSNGEKLISLCEENKLVIGGTLFQHKRIHKSTWKSPDGKTENQIDHVLINSKWKRSLQDVVVKRGADIGSDHYLVVASLKLKLKKSEIAEKRKLLFDSKKLEDSHIKKAFTLELKNRFSILQEESELTLNKVNEAMTETAKTVLGYKKKKKEQWISNKTWNIISERKKLKEKLLNTKSQRQKERIQKEYKEKDIKVKAACRQDKREYYDSLANKAENASLSNDTKTLYNIIKQLANNFNYGNNGPLKGKDGKDIIDEKEKIKRWKEYFGDLLNRPPPAQHIDIPPSQEELDIHTGPIQVSEVQAAIQKLKSGKAPGTDCISAEMLKAESTDTSKILCKILQDIWNTEKTPEEWQTGLIVKLPKKGSQNICENWRGITLLPLSSKIFCRIILERISRAVESKIRKEQAGFRKGKSCIDQIFTLRQIIEQNHEWNGPLYALFIDFEKAFDSIDRDSLWKILRWHGFPNKIISAIKIIYERFQCRVVCGNHITEPFEVHTGVKQGCVLSPLLFNLVIDWLMTQTTDKPRGIRWTLTTSLEDLDFADDITLLASSHKDMQEKLNRLISFASNVGLKLNKNKTKLIKQNAGSNQPIKIDNTEVEIVNNFTYLGSIISSEGDCTTEIKTRISKAKQAFAAMQRTWKSKKISLKTKCRLFKSNVLSVLLYGSECWKETTTIIRSLDSFQTKCLRRIKGIHWPNTISNDNLLRETEMEPISGIIEKRRWRWMGHVLRMGSDEIPATALKWTPQGKRKKGRPKETWRRTAEKQLKKRGLSWGTAKKVASDRQKWKQLSVDGPMCPGH